MPPPFAKKKSSDGVHEPMLHAQDPNKAATFINLTIIDASDAVHSMVKSKIESKQAKLSGPAKLKQKVANTVAKAAAAFVPPKAIAEQLSKKLPKMLMYKMSQKGMKLAAQTVFVEDSYVVIQLQVQHVDSVKLMNNMAEDSSKDADAADGDDSVATAVLDEWMEEQQQLLQEEKDSPFVTTAANNNNTATAEKPKDWKEGLVKFFEWLISAILPVKITRSLEEDGLPAMIQSKLSETMQSMMEQKLAGKSLKANVAVLAQADEARYFFTQLQNVRSGV